MNQNRLVKYNIVTSLLAAGFMLLGVAVSFIRYQSISYSLDYNQIRQQLNPDRLSINQCYLQNSRNYPTSIYPYLVADQSGNVIYADVQWGLEAGDTVALEELLQLDQNFEQEYENQVKATFILYDTEVGEGQCVGYLVYLIPDSVLKQELYQRNQITLYAPVVLGVLVSGILILFRMYYCNKRILYPLQRISTSANAIINGNYDIEVHRVLERQLKTNEVSNLIYSFEMMRDELKAKQMSEAQLKKSQQELISCISHDLRTPISTIKAYGEGLRDGIAVDKKERQEYLEIIIQKTGLLEHMIKELLEFSNAQLNKIDIRLKEQYLNEYLKDISRELRIYVQQNAITFECEIPCDNVLVRMDARRITEVLYNLVENSIKYIGDGPGVIQLRVRQVEDHVEIHILDNGIGIGAEDIPYVFDKFYRAEKSRSSHIAGSGLGLSICRHIINQHGGEIYCASRKPSGADFWFTLPI